MEDFSQERSDMVNDLLAAYNIIRPRADRHYVLIPPQWGKNVRPQGCST